VGKGVGAMKEAEGRGGEVRCRRGARVFYIVRGTRVSDVLFDGVAYRLNTGGVIACDGLLYSFEVFGCASIEKGSEAKELSTFPRVQRLIGCPCII
jgi:hypothetical protein